MRGAPDVHQGLWVGGVGEGVGGVTGDGGCVD